MDDGDQNGHPEIGIDQGPDCPVFLTQFGFPAEPEIDRHQHKRRAMGNCHGKRPKPQLRRSYPGQCSRMTPVDEAEDAEPDDKEAGGDLYLALPIDEGDQQSEGKDYEQHREQMADP